jgi:uncharacterized protein
LSRKHSRISPATVFFALLSLLLGVLLYIQTRPARPAREVPAPEAPPRPRVSAPARPRVRPSPRLPPATVPGQKTESVTGPKQHGARVAILIDDLGNDLAAVARISRWPYVVSTAVLPGLPGSARSARELQSSGKEVLLHLPMEPKGFPAVRPGPGVLLKAQSDEQIGATLEADLASVPGVVGVNNHMGSAATADPRVMRVVMRVLADRGLFFVDSRTTDATVGEAQARAAGVPAVSRRVFLDDTATDASVEKALAELVARSRTEGFAVGIGHPHPATLAVLERELPRLGEEGVRLVRVSELVR